MLNPTRSSPTLSLGNIKNPTTTTTEFLPLACWAKSGCVDNTAFKTRHFTLHTEAYKRMQDSRSTSQAKLKV